VGEWFSIEVFDAKSSARSWAEGYGDSLLYAAQLEGALDWNWHHHRWGAVLEIELPDELAWERFCEAPGVKAALDAVPDPIHGLMLHRGRGGSSGSRQPRRPRPFTGAGSAQLPIPEELVEESPARPAAILMG
jgi:hypothetical protein